MVESSFDFASLFHGHGTGQRMGGRGAVSEIVLKYFVGHVFFGATTIRIARPCLSYDLWRRNQDKERYKIFK